MANIGFVGLGHMGLPMAINLLKAGHQVTGFDLQPTSMDAFMAAGGIGAKKHSDAASMQDIIITMLQTGQQVKHVCFGETGLFAFAKPNTLFIDCSSIDVQSARDIHDYAKEKNLLALDAPVSGGVAGATAATLTFMVGGPEPTFMQAKSTLSAMGEKIIHAGDAGSGQAAKICNNMILGVSMIAVSEAFLLAQALGLTAQKLHEIVTNASGRCWITDNYVPVADVLPNVPANHGYQPGFSAAMMLKDLGLSQECATTVGVKTPISALATALYQQLKDKGMEGLDFSAIITLLTAT